MALQERGAEIPQLELPDPGPAQYLIEYLFEVGPASAGEIVNYQEIDAWCRRSGVNLSGWEAKTIRALSAAYLGEYHAAKDPRRGAPFFGDHLPDRDEVDRKLRSAFSALKRRRNP